MPTPHIEASLAGRISAPLADDATAAALRLALDDSTRGLRLLDLSLEGPTTWAPTNSSGEWAHRAGQV
ncbi:hypothetical protein ACFXB3_10260 [Streptomyces sp. NPDC059447]|uniref:hypothetical protein n=1 Tax=Streptomyces sp. NPDC059447 TaxID=3346834 RepID=UPI0036955E28